MSKVKPNFLVLGAAKTGTTSLYEYLRQHPDVFMPTKETFFFPQFSKGIGIKVDQRGTGFFLDRFPGTAVRNGDSFLFGHFKKKKIGQLFDIVAVIDAVMA